MPEIITVPNFLDRSGYVGLGSAGCHHGKPFHLDEANSLQKGFFKDINWQRFKTCFVERGICNVTTNVAVDPVHNPVQWGCCRPPLYCGYEQKNQTFWEIPEVNKALGAKDTGECSIWSNRLDIQCFDCDTCRAGFLIILHKYTELLIMLAFIEILFNIFVFSTIFHNERKARKHKYGGPPISPIIL
ncbi:tetraspanin-12-like [Carica papaya]|uniref:tetraspanin-12-like n=1 Tax=Carica papaya TaxID=3649 RepID=UPI000B8C8369|nr:tetraspanin-12-like [Carica papaya]